MIIQRVLIGVLAFMTMLLSNLARSRRLSLLRTGGAALGAKFSHLHWLGHTMFKRFFSTTPGLRASLTPAKVDGRKNLKTVGWKMYAYFHRHNTVCLLVEVVEDLDFMKKNQHLSYNEKVLYYMQLPHHPKLHITAGQLGFRKAQRQEYEAGFQVALKLFRTIEDEKLIGPKDKIELIVKDFGKGRDAFFAALQGKEGTNIRKYIDRIYDNTKLKFGGNRPKKLRRL